jgi:hypothetical protein
MANFTIKKTITLANSVKLEEIFSLDLKNYLENFFLFIIMNTYNIEKLKLNKKKFI